MLDVQLCGYVIQQGHKRRESILSLAALYAARGFAHMRLGAPQRAIEDYHTALALNPVSASAWLRQAIAQRELNQFDAALESLERTIELSPLKSNGFRERGYTRLILGNYLGAREDLDRALEVAPADAGVRALRGVVHYLSGRWREARADFDHAEQLSFEYDYLRVWQVLTSMRAGAESPETTPGLAADMKFLDHQQWPYPLLSHLAGNSRLETVVAAVHGPEGEAGHPEAFFYLGELALIRKDSKLARKYLARAASLGVRNAERYLARLRLAGPTAGQ